MIPILGVPIVNGFRWLQRLVDSIDFPVDKLVIINNSENKDITDQTLLLSAQKHSFINHIHVCNLPSNIGVAASWNLIIKSNIKAPYWLICNHDIAFTSGLLEAFYNSAQQVDVGIIHGNKGDFEVGSYDIFLIKDWTIQKLGLFDENFYPAYCEDVDYAMRLYNHNLIDSNDFIKKEYLNVPYYHGDLLSSDSDYYNKSGSQSARESLQIFHALQRINITNMEYMDKKWGNTWKEILPFAYPMNIENIPLSYTCYDLNFCRSKHVDLNGNTDTNFENTNVNHKQEELIENMNIFYNDSHPDQDNGIIETNQFIINPQSDNRLFVVDNFYEDPIAVREFALSQTYFPGEGAVGHRTRKQFLFTGIKEKFEKIMNISIPDHTESGFGWKDIGINGRFQYCEAGTSLVYHCDAQKWAAMIFLCPDAPPSAGTSFFRHKETKIYHNSQIKSDIDLHKVFNQHTFLDPSPYEKIDNVANIFNRLVIFDGGLIHSASEYFGWNIYTSRLFHIFFFDQF
jgi:hypothetical protein